MSNFFHVLEMWIGMDEFDHRILALPVGGQCFVTAPFSRYCVHFGRYVKLDKKVKEVNKGLESYVFGTIYVPIQSKWTDCKL